MDLGMLLQGIPHTRVGGDLHTPIRGIAYDSRQVQEGYLFVAIEGFRDDGHRYLGDAQQRGAACLVAQRDGAFPAGGDTARILVPDARAALARISVAFYGDPSSSFRLLGVTGTNGKTSVCSLIKTILRSAGRKTGLLGTIENTLDDEIIPATHTTPESRDLQHMFRILAGKGADYCVMEVSSHALALERVTGSHFQAAVFTNFTQDHLDFHPDMESYLDAKKNLFRMLSREAGGLPGKAPYAVINRDDPHSREIAKAAECRKVYFGVERKAPYMARDIRMGLEGIRFALVHPGGVVPIRLQMTGGFAVYNCLAAATVALEEGVETDIIRKALAETGVPGRFEPVREGQEFAVVVDYAHTPDSLLHAIRSARGVTDHRVITVFGCGGDRDRSKRPLMGDIGTREGDYAIITSDNPRTEEPAAILEDIVRGIQAPGARYEVIEDRRDAIRRGIGLAEPGDLVLIAGKGHEDYQIIGEQKYPFSDRLVAREAIRERLGI